MNAIPEDLDVRLREVEMSSRSNADKLTSHEDLCAERYRHINESIGSISATIKWAGAGLIAGMLSILVKLLFFP